VLSRFHLIPERNGQTDGQRDRQTDLLYQYRASVCWRAIKITPDRRLCFFSLNRNFWDHTPSIMSLCIGGWAVHYKERVMRVSLHPVVVQTSINTTAAAADDDGDDDDANQFDVNSPRPEHLLFINMGPCSRWRSVFYLGLYYHRRLDILSYNECLKKFHRSLSLITFAIKRW